MELIRIEKRNIGDGEIPTVNVRELHGFLESKQEFSSWIKGRVEQFGFTENKDFLIILSESGGGRPRVEYHLTIDMAKELSISLKVLIL